MRSHEIDYKIIGEDIQIVEVELDPNETVIAEAGTMLYMEDGIQFETKMGDGSQPTGGFLGKLMQVGSRLVTGESLFMTHFTNRGYTRSKVAFAEPYPGTVIPIDLAQLPGNALIAQRDSFLCAALGTGISMHFNRNLGSGFFGGEGFILQRLQGDGLAFVHAGGTVMPEDHRTTIVFAVYVTPARRGTGVLAELVEAVAAWSRAVGRPELMLEVVVGNDRAVRA